MLRIQERTKKTRGNESTDRGEKKTTVEKWLAGSTLLMAVFVFSLTGLQKAHAGILLEPYLGYEFGTADQTYGSSNDGKSTKFLGSGTVIGARVGWTIPFLFFALDYSMGTGQKFTVHEDSLGSVEDQDGSRSTLAAVVGVKVPLLRAYAGYAFINDLKNKDSVSDDTLKGSAVKLGASFTGFPLISLNAEYLVSTYNKMVPGNGSEYTLGSDQTVKEAKSQMLLLSVSVPFDI